VRQSKQYVFLLIGGFVFFFVVGCSGISSKQDSSEVEYSFAQSSSEPFIIYTSAETDPYSDSQLGNDLPDKVELFFFYEQDCEICNELDNIHKIVSQKLPQEIRNIYPCKIYAINFISIEGRKMFEQLTDAMGLDRMLLSAPLLIAGGKIFQGYETISNNIEEAFLTAGEDIFVNHQFYNPALKKTGDRLFDDYSLKSDHINIVYFYRTVCPYCNQITPFINELPPNVNLDEGQIPLNIIRINTRSGNNNERIIAFFDKYQVLDADRKVPIIFLTDSYLSGVESIKMELTDKLSQPSSKNKLEELIVSQK
jgi:thiol-disulfide isomerase/thioredoxin